MSLTYCATESELLIVTPNIFSVVTRVTSGRCGGEVTRHWQRQRPSVKIISTDSPQIVFLDPRFDVFQLSGTRLHVAGWYYQVLDNQVTRIDSLEVGSSKDVRRCPIPEPWTMLAVMARIAEVTPPYLVQCVCLLK